MNKEEKAVEVASLADDMRESDSIIVADYRGLDMPSITELRNLMREQGGRFRVVKNTLGRIAAEQAECDTLVQFLTGPTAVAFVRGDAAAVAKALSDFGKTNDALQLRGGIIDGIVVDDKQVVAIAKLPPRETLLAMLLSALNGPMASLVGVLDAPARDLLGILDAYIEKRKAEEAA